MKNKFGFGCMRPPMQGDAVDIKQFTQMVDMFMDAGFNYFDTAHVYVNGKSETAMREALTSRYPRDSYIFTNKLSSSCIQSEEDIRPFFDNQLQCCGVDYFDYYLIHAVASQNYPKFKKWHAFEAALQLKAEGKIRHMGISFHDKAAVLEQVLIEQPEIEVVQLQFNYADYDAPSIESHVCYQVCQKYNKPVIVMEPVKGGELANLPDEARAVLDGIGCGSYAGFAIRYCASFDDNIMVISGMSDVEQMADNISQMKDFVPFTQEEYEAAARVREILKKQDTIACTACKYCVDGCPQNISIPDLFACYNARKQNKSGNSGFYYNVYTTHHGKASDCIACGVCEEACPQHLPIRALLQDVAKEFEQK